MTQEIAVYIIVAVAAAYVLWRYVPASWRKRVHPALGASSGCGSGGGGCGGCASAGSSCPTERGQSPS